MDKGFDIAAGTLKHVIDGGVTRAGCDGYGNTPRP